MKRITHFFRVVFSVLFGLDSHSKCRYCDQSCEARPCSQTPEVEDAFERSELSRLPSYGRSQHIPAEVRARQVWEWDELGSLEPSEEVGR